MGSSSNRLVGLNCVSYVGLLLVVGLSVKSKSGGATDDDDDYS